MKVIMDINKDILTDVKGTDFDRARNIVRSYQATIADAIQNSIVLPDNATNGDMIKAMFDIPDSEIDEGLSTTYSYTSKRVLKGGSQDYLRKQITFSRDWWNAPYKCNLSEKPTGSESEE
jgi:hypothetical protein